MRTKTYHEIAQQTDRILMQLPKGSPRVDRVIDFFVGVVSRLSEEREKKLNEAPPGQRYGMDMALRVEGQYKRMTLDEYRPIKKR